MRPAARTPGRARTPRPCARRAFSTGEAARCCLVTADTLANWISRGLLPAQRTAGGQYRIRCEDLRAFMQAHGMRTDVLDERTGRAPACWEFWALPGPGHEGRPAAVSCVDCPVFRARAAVCSEVRPLLPGGTVRAASCARCAYRAACAGREPLPPEPARKI